MFLTARAGTAVTVNFIADGHAGLAQIALDGLNITAVDTHNISARDTRDCTPVSWSSGNLPSGGHTVALYPLKASMDVHNFVYVIRSYCTYPCADLFPSYTGEPVSSTLPLAKSTQTFQSGRSSNLRNEILAVSIIIPATMGMALGLISIATSMYCLAYFRHSCQKRRSSDLAKADSTFSDDSYSTPSRTVASLGTRARLSNWTRSL